MSGKLGKIALEKLLRQPPAKLQGVLREPANGPLVRDLLLGGGLQLVCGDCIEGGNQIRMGPTEGQPDST